MIQSHAMMPKKRIDYGELKVVGLIWVKGLKDET